MSQEKQTSIEWLFAHLVPHLDWSKVEDRELFRKLKAEAQQMHKEEIVNSANKLLYRSTGHGDTAAEEYYNQTYG